MSEYTEVERPFLDQLATLGWTAINQGSGVPQDAGQNDDLQFHWKCIMAPLKVIDYIVVHELCHLHHRDHSDAFWNEVDKVLPDCRDRRDWLRVRGAALSL